MQMSYASTKEMLFIFYFQSQDPMPNCYQLLPCVSIPGKEMQGLQQDFTPGLSSLALPWASAS